MYKIENEYKYVNKYVHTKKCVGGIVKDQIVDKQKKAGKDRWLFLDRKNQGKSEGCFVNTQNSQKKHGSCYIYYIVKQKTAWTIICEAFILQKYIKSLLSLKKIFCYYTFKNMPCDLLIFPIVCAWMCNMQPQPSCAPLINITE